MQYRENGTRYKDYRMWEDRKMIAYNYEQDGLLKHLLSNKIVNSKNPILKIILSYYEQTIIYMLKYVDELKNFKNYHAKNR